MTFGLAESESNGDPSHAVSLEPVPPWDAGTLQQPIASHEDTGSTRRLGSTTDLGAERSGSERLGEVLDDVLAHVVRFVWFSRAEQAVAVTLWIAHTHAFDAIEQSPILAVLSPAKQSGKTRLFEVIETLVPRPWRIERPSEAVLFRRIERDAPTIFLDEADAIFADRSTSFEGVRALYNAGNRRGTVVSRVLPKGQTFELIDFRIFCPKAIAGIGRMPETIVDRSLVITMARRTRLDPVERLRHRTADALGAPLRARLAAALADQADLSLPDSALPAELDDRAQDNWEGLLALAGRAGGDWPSLAGAAAIALQSDRQAADENAGIRLLADLRSIFDARAASFFASADVLEALAAIDGAPWGDWRAGRPISGRGLADLLKPFGVKSEHTSSARGYARRALEDPWARYLPPPPEQASQASGASPAGARAESGVTRMTHVTPFRTSAQLVMRAAERPASPGALEQSSLDKLVPQWRCPVDLGSGHVPTLRGDGTIYCVTCHPRDLAGHGSVAP